MRDRFALVVAAAGLAACGFLGPKEDARGTSARAALFRLYLAHDAAGHVIAG